MKKMLTIVAILVVAVAAVAIEAQEKQTSDDAAIKKAVQEYVGAFNRGDVATVASFWTDDGEYVAPSGDRFKGRKKIEAALKRFFTENKGVQLQVSTSSVRFPYPDRAVETGIATVNRPGQAPEETQYVAAYIKKGGDWKLTSVKEQESSVAYQHLKRVEWLIGEWIDKDENSTLDTVYQWARNNSFITGSFSVYIKGKVDLQGTQVIGWDPVAKVIRSWVFDSQGGFGQGTWSKKGNAWVVDSSSILSTGEKASSINTYTYVDENTFTFQSEGRDIAGEPMPDIAPVTVIRKQPAAPRTGK